MTDSTERFVWRPGDVEVLEPPKLPGKKAASDVGPSARGHLSSLIKYYMSKPHPFTSCVRDNTKRFGADGAKRVCATLKDIGMGTTHWRNKKSVEDDDVIDDMVNALYDAADGNVDSLLEMHQEYMMANGDKHVQVARETTTLRGNSMEHLTLKAAVTQTAETTDQGLFEAVISTRSVDREKDMVEPSALVHALSKWPRPIPLAWGHQTKDSQDIFGAIDPASVHEVDGEVRITGQVDLESERGRDAWRLFKSRTIGFSYGYLQIQPPERKAGGNHITELDVFEVTATPTPMNNDTRVLSAKGVEHDYTHDETAAQTGFFDADELNGVILGLIKAVWTTAYINDLPDGCFLYVESGGTKDAEGKTTPRSLRHFPVKNADGSVDMPHLRNALARIPQSKLSDSVKDRCKARAERMMDDNKTLSHPTDPQDAVAAEPLEASRLDPLWKRDDAVPPVTRSHELSTRKKKKNPPDVDSRAVTAEARRTLLRLEMEGLI